MISFVALLAVAAPNVSGKIVFEGTPPVPKKIEPTTDAAICGQQDLVDESLLVDAKTKGVQNVVVRVEDTKAPAKAGRLDNYRCRFDPHVLIVPAGTGVTIGNRDRFLHTAQAKSSEGRSIFNVPLPQKDSEVKKKVEKPGAYSVHCDVHDWMRAWIFATGGEITAISGADGSFELDGLAPGKYKLKLWHETLGEKTADVVVAADKPATLEIRWARANK